jgi:hypothetical protein
VVPRGTRQKRDQNVAGCILRLRSSGPNVSEPRRSLVKEIGEAEPLEKRRRQNRPARVGKGTGLLTRGSRDGTLRRVNVEHGRSRPDRMATETEGQGASRGQRAGREVGRVRSTCDGGESHSREGALLDDATTAVKERGLWRH